MRSFLLIASFLFVSNVLLAQTLGKGYYVVVGAYAASKEAYAQKFVDKLNKEGFNAIYAKDEKRKLFLVYIEKYGEYKPSISKMTSTRKEQRFPEAWVRIIRDEEGTRGRGEEVTKRRGEEVTSERREEVKTQEAKPVVVAKEEEEKKEEKKKEENEEGEIKERENPVLSEVKEPEEKEVPRDTSSSRPLVPSSSSPSPRLTFNMFDATNSKPIDGGIEIVDAERARLMQKNKATDTVFLPDPKSKSGTVTFITDVFGYRKVQYEINYKQPVVDSTSHYIDHYMDDEGDYYIMQFEMARYHKGDIATLYNVFFFNDAAIMMPESKYELNKLLELMQSNSKYRIKLHGHTNGNSRGKIISMGPSKNFFAVSASDVKTGKGTAKDLSRERAEVIREWLIAQGISGDRIEVRSWGGRRMIHDKNGVNAKRNVRVEVEVLSE